MNLRAQFIRKNAKSQVSVKEKKNNYYSFLNIDSQRKRKLNSKPAYKITNTNAHSCLQQKLFLGNFTFTFSSISKEQKAKIMNQEIPIYGFKIDRMPQSEKQMFEKGINSSDH
jgi:hypothetical protein